MKRKTLTVGIWTGAGALVLAAALPGACLGDTLVKKGEALVASGDAAATQTEAVHLTFDARGIEKWGTGTYTLPCGLVDAKNPFDLRVQRGRVTVTDAGSVPAESEAPTALLNLATFWVEASVNAATNAEGNVMTWYDCREEAGESGYGTTYCRATTITNPTKNGAVYEPVLPKAETPPDGTRPMINFGGMTTGTGMDFSTSYSSIRHVFAVVDFQTSYGFFLGSPANVQPFLHPSNYDKTGVTGTYANTDTYPPTCQGEFLVNGVRYESTSTGVRKGLQLIEIHADYHAPMSTLGTFFKDRTIGGRYGGDFIGEVLVYNGGTKALSVEERHRISRYLMNKWGITPPKGALSVKTAKGGEVDIREKDCVTLTGQGVLVKSGTDAAVYRPVSTNRMTGVGVAVEGGTLVADVRELNYAPKAGETVSETADRFARRTVTSAVDPAMKAAGRVAFTGGGVGLRLGDLDAGVSNVVADSQQVILGRNGLGGAVLAPADGAATIANASFETAFGADDWVTEKDDGGVWRLTLTTDGQVEDWRLGNPTAEFRKDCRHARYYAPDGQVALCLHNTSIVRGKVSVPADGDYLFGFEATGRYTYDNEELTFSLIDASNVTNTFASCITKCGDGFRPYFIPVRGLKAGAYTLRIAGQHHTSDRGGYGKESFAIIDKLTLVPLADSSAVAGAVAVPNGSFENTRFTTFDRRVERFGSDSVACAGWTFTESSSGDDVAPAARYMPNTYIAQSNPYGEWELHFNGTTGRATTAAFSIPAGRWRLRCRGARWAFASNAWSGHTNGRNINPVIGVKVSVNGEERCDMLSGGIWQYDFTTVTFGTTIEVAATDKIVLEVRQNATGDDTAAANMKVDEFEFVPEATVVDLVKNGSFEDGATAWTSCGKSGSSTWVQELGTAPNNDWGNQRFDGSHAMFFTRLAARSQAIDFPAAGVYRLSFWARSRVSNYGRVDTTQFGGNVLRASLIDGAANATILVDTPRLYSTNFFETAVLFRVPEAGAYTLKFEGLEADDRTAALDAVSVRAVADASAPNVPENLDLRLGADSTLRLDYDGDLKVERLRIGRKHFYGTVDATDASGLVSGIGRITVTGPRPGAVLFLR